MRGLHEPPRTSHKDSVRRMEVALTHERRKFAAVDQERKAALYDLAEAKKKIAAMEREIKRCREDQQPTLPGAA